jgi:catechol 2,3-dioxygenase-like lactoylglutathione lyase family enzyme
MYNKISVVSIPVKDQEASKSFYTNMLGCKVIEEVPFGSNGNTKLWLQLQLPGVETTLSLVNWIPQMPPGSLQGVVLTTDDIAKTNAELKKRGLAISDIDHQPYGSEATFSDPDGIGWILQQTAPGH